MPNIILVGFGKIRALSLRKQIEDILAELGFANEAITTVLSATTKYCSKNAPAPYLIVRDTKYEEGVIIAKKLNQEMNLDVELEKIDRFLEATTPPTITDNTAIQVLSPKANIEATIMPDDPISDKEWEQIRKATPHTPAVDQFLLHLQYNGNRPRKVYPLVKGTQLEYLNGAFRRLGFKFRVRTTNNHKQGVMFDQKEFRIVRVP